MIGEIESGGIAKVRTGLEVGEEGDVDGINKIREFEHIVRVDSFEVAEGSNSKESYGDGHVGLELREELEKMMGEIKSGGIAEARMGLEVGEEVGVDGRNKMREFEHIVRVDSFEVAKGYDPKESYGDGHVDVV
ncbi:hypothetical protein GIB67_008842 [Kingdonia uniflora]|uniref:Uncharacterized protein n=1 Tax=Kingdonia uniflora TaxID=39325 RepID=A0A7J7LV78_9MAGN|nr:hypothetical protein GIB67_008842 [Kingdonia uniflora]